MKKRKRSVVLGVIGLALVLAALPLGAACADSGEPSEYEIEIYGGKAGMSTYVAAIALAELINDNSTWLGATAIESPSVTVNFQLLYSEPERRDDTLIISMVQFAELAREGKDPFTTPYDGLRFIAAVGYNAMGFITLDSDTKTVADFRDKTVSIGDLSSVTRVEMLQTIMESAGVLDEVDLQYLDLQAGVNALRDGLIDATLGSLTLVSPPDNYAVSPYLSELMSTKTVYFVSMDSEDIAYMNEVLGPLETEHIIPAGSMGDSQTEPWIGIGKVMGWAADVEMPDDVVYEICRIIYEHADEFEEYSTSLAFVSQETMPKWGVPDEDMHPGALEFYEEKGLEITSF